MQTPVSPASRPLAITLDEWHRRARFERFAGHQIAWWQQGEGDALILIHGFPTAAWDWQYVWEPLARRYRVVTLDLLGFGWSDKPWPHHYSIFKQADILQALVKSLGIQKYHVLAHDYGDTVAQELLARHNKQDEGKGFLRSVCLLNGGLFPETHQPVLVQRLLLSPVGPLLSRCFNRAALARNFRKIFGPNTPPSDAELDGFWALLEHDEGYRVLPGLIWYMQERRDYRTRWVGALQQATIPLKLINGNTDPISGAHMVQRYEELIAKPDITNLASIGHYPQVEAPEEVLQAYLEFRGR